MVPNETTERATIFSGLFVSRTAPPRSPATWGLQSASVRAARMHNTRSRVIFFSSDLRVLEHLGLRRLLDRVSEKLRPLLKFLDLLLLPRCRRSMQSCFCLSVLAASTSALPASARPSLHIYMHMHISVVADEKQASRRCTLCQLIRYTKLTATKPVHTNEFRDHSVHLNQPPGPPMAAPTPPEPHLSSQRWRPHARPVPPPFANTCTSFNFICLRQKVLQGKPFYCCLI